MKTKSENHTQIIHPDSRFGSGIIYNIHKKIGGKGRGDSKIQRHEI